MMEIPYTQCHHQMAYHFKTVSQAHTLTSQALKFKYTKLIANLALSITELNTN